MQSWKISFHSFLADYVCEVVSIVYAVTPNSSLFRSSKQAYTIVSLLSMLHLTRVDIEAGWKTSLPETVQCMLD